MLEIFPQALTLRFFRLRISFRAQLYSNNNIIRSYLSDLLFKIDQILSNPYRKLSDSLL
jgi:hypothetical protein